MAKIAPTNKNILVVAGDPSGDLHAANLIKALRDKDPEISVTSLGGVRMQEVSAHFIYNLVSVGAVGFAEPFKNFFLWLKLIKLVRRYLEDKRPACVIAVDFYGFNNQVLGLAAPKIPAFYYISPQVWASRPGRAAASRNSPRNFRHLPFEEALYKKVGGTPPSSATAADLMPAARQGFSPRRRRMEDRHTARLAQSGDLPPPAAFRKGFLPHQGAASQGQGLPVRSPRIPRRPHSAGARGNRKILVQGHRDSA